MILLYAAQVQSLPPRGGWRTSGRGWEYVEQDRVLVRLTSDWDGLRPAKKIDGINVFRDVDGMSVCGCEGPRLLWARRLDLGSPDPLVAGKRLLALRSGKYIVWGHVDGEDDPRALRRRWAIRRRAERVEVLTARGRTLFSRSVYDVGDPRRFVGDQYLWTVREANLEVVFLGTQGHPVRRYALCLVDLRGRIEREFALPSDAGGSWSLPWRTRTGADGFEHVSHAGTFLFRYRGTLLIPTTTYHARNGRLRGQSSGVLRLDRFVGALRYASKGFLERC